MESAMKQAALNNITTAAINSLRSGEGFTIFATDGAKYTGDLWLVGGIIPSLALSDGLSAVEFSRRIAEWYEGVLALDGDSGLIGGWVSDGTLYLDLVSLVSERDTAVLLGKLWEQVAIGRLEGDEYHELVLV